MRKGISIIIGIIVIIALILIFLPAMYSSQAKHQLQAVVKRINATYQQQGIVAKITQAKTGWYHSRYTVTITITNKQFQQFYKQSFDSSFVLGSPLSMKEIVTVSHGPIIYDSRSPSLFAAGYVRGYDVLPEAMQARLGAKGRVLHFAGSISYGGKYDGVIQLSPLHYKSAELNVNFAGLDVKGMMALDGTAVQGVAKSQAITVDMPFDKTKIVIGPGQRVFDFKRNALGLWVGHAHFSVNNAVVSLPSNPDLPATSEVVQSPVTLHYKGMDGKVNISQTGNDYTFVVNANIKQIHLPASMSKSQDVKNVKLTFGLHNLNAKGLVAMRSAILATTGQQSIAPQQMQKLIQGLFTAKTLIKLDNFSATMPQGSYSLSGQLGWPNLQANAPLMMLFLGAKAELSANVSKGVMQAWLKQADRTFADDDAHAHTHGHTHVAKSNIVLAPGPVLLNKHGKPMKPAKKEEQSAKPAMPSDFVTQSFNQAVKNGFVTLKDGQYHTKITYSVGQIKANGKPFHE